MKYLLLMYANESTAPKTPEEYQVASQTWNAFSQEILAAGVVLSNSGLSPVATATTIRVRDSKSLITDGPFAETHEQLGGYFLIEADNLDEATSIAARIPSARTGTIEVRPLAESAAEAAA